MNRIFIRLLLQIIILCFASSFFFFGCFFSLKGTCSFEFWKTSSDASLRSGLEGVTDGEDIPLEETIVPDESAVAVGLIFVLSCE
jgi:hypothetical protein